MIFAGCLCNDYKIFTKSPLTLTLRGDTKRSFVEEIFGLEKWNGVVVSYPTQPACIFLEQIHT